MAIKHKCSWTLRSVKVVKSYICDVCHKLTKKNTKLNVANSVLNCLSGYNSRYFKCSGCTKSFGQKGSLHVHMRRHSESKPYICIKCNKRFITRAGLIMHREIHQLKPIKTDELDYDGIDISQMESGAHDKMELQLPKLSKENSIFHGLSGSLSSILEKNSFSQPINAQLTRLENGTLSLSLQQDHNHNQSTQSAASKSRNVVGQFTTVNVGEKSELVLFNSENTNSSSNTTGQCCNTPIILNKTSSASTNKTSVGSLCDVKSNIDTSGYKFTNQWQKSNEEITQMECLVSTSDLCTEVVNHTNCFSSIKTDTRDSVMLLVGSSQVSAKEIITQNKHDNHLKGACTRMKTKSNDQNQRLSPKVTHYRMVTRSLSKQKAVSTNKEGSTNKKHCANLQESPDIPKNMSHRVKTLIIGSVEKDAYNVEADAEIHNNILNDGVKKVLYFQCSMCPTKHLSEDDLEQHEKLHFVKKKKLFKCDICKLMYLDESSLTAHCRRHTREVYFSQVAHYDPVHTKNKIFYCSTCYKEFSNRRSMKRHEKSHKPKTNFKCKKCDKECLSAKTIVNHIEKPKKCDLCSQLFCTLSQLSLHKFVSHVDALSVSKAVGKYCQFCNKTFKKVYSFYTHMKKHVQEGMSVKFPCVTCRESFDSFELLLDHRKIHRVQHVKYLSCPWSHCKKRFTYKSRLDLHAKSHNGERNYLCYRCGMHFTDCVFYSKHRAVCRNKGMQLTCKLCGKKLCGYTSLKQHSRVHSGEKPQQCEICGTRFRETHHLRRHRLIHVKKGEVSLEKQSSTSSALTTVSSATPQPFQSQDKPLEASSQTDFSEQRSSVMNIDDHVFASDIELLVATAEIELVSLETV